MGKRLFENRVALTTVILLVLGAATLFMSRKSSVPVFQGFVLRESAQEDALTHFYQFENGTTVLKLKGIPNVNESEANKIVEGKILTLEALYGNELSPYPGMLSNEIVCSGDMVPKKQNVAVGSLELTYFVAALTDRLTYGNCVESETPYRGFIAWAFCPGKKEYRQMELISPKADFDEKGVGFIGKNICN